MRQSLSSVLAIAVAAMILVACLGTSQTGNIARANSRYKGGDYVGTIELADFVLGQGPVNDEIGAQAGLLKASSLDALGRRQEAIAVYRYLVETYSDSVSGAQAAGRLAELEGD